MRSILTYCLLAGMAFQVPGIRAQISFMPLDENISQVPGRTCFSQDGQLLVVSAEKLIGYANANLFVKQWNGQFWINYPGFYSDQFEVTDDNLLSVCMHAGRIYAAGSFHNKDTSRVGIASWNGTKWEKTAGGISSNYLIHQDISIKDMLSYQNKLFVCGRFNLAGGLPVHNFVYLQANQWMPLQTGLGKVNDLEILNDTLYCAGKFDQVEGVLNQNIAAYVNGQWLNMPSPANSEIAGLGSYGQSLMAFTGKMAFLRSGNTWKAAAQKWDFTIERFCNSATYEGKFYLAGTFRDSKGEKSHLLRWDGQSWEVVVRHANVSPSNQLSYFIDARGSELLFSGYITRFFGSKVQHIVQLFPDKTIVKGRIYIDKNQNCSFDGGDEPLSNALVSVDDGTYFKSADANGLYAVALEKNKKSSVRIFPASDMESVCQGEYIEITSSGRDSTISRDFALQPRPMPPLKQDLDIYSSRGFKARHGYSSDYTISYQSMNGKFPVTIRLQHDKRLLYESADIEPVSIVEGEMSWIIYGNTEINLRCKLPLNISTGDKLMFRAHSTYTDTLSVRPLTGTLEQVVVSAFDPNEKQCSANKISKISKSLDYHVQFQNLGNDSAVNVYVVDTISHSLPMQFIQMQDYSHKNNYNINFKVRDHAIIWGFNNILLPPKSVAGDKASSGYIKFKAGLVQPLKIGDSISNQAHIYFDYQAPVHTNKVITRVVENIPLNPGNGQLDLYLYPNPVSSQLTLDMSPYLMQNVKIYDLSGKLIFSRDLSPVNSIVTIYPGELAAGIYTVRVEHTFGVISRKFVVTN